MPNPLPRPGQVRSKGISIPGQVGNKGPGQVRARLGARLNTSTHPIIAKFEHFKQKEMVKSKGKERKGTQFGMIDQFPREINERCKALYPIMKENRIINVPTW